MSVTAYQLAGSLVTPIIDRRFYRYLVGLDAGIVNGCEMVPSGTNINISAGWGIVKGCIFNVESEAIACDAPTSGSASGRLLLQINVSTNTASFITQYGTTLPSLVQDDINGGGSIYQMVLATYTISATTISDFVIAASTLDELRSLINSVQAIANAAVPSTRKVNNKALSSDITLSASDVDAVPTTRTVNSKALSTDITLTASDVSAVPTTRKVNNKALSDDVTLSASDVSAVPTTRRVNGNALSADVTVTRDQIAGIVKNGASASANKSLNMTLSGTTLTITFS